MVSMGKYLGKSLCASVRQGDYAHAGETAAIDMVMAPFAKKNDQIILDVGCGLGGTASYIQENKWGQVLGFDIEQDSIAYAQAKYANVKFYVADVINVCNVIKNVSPNIICIFNVFFTLPNQQLALAALHKIAQPNGSLAIFDYSDLCKNNETNPMCNFDPKAGDIVAPIKPHKIEAMLAESGWQLDKLVDISADYKRWYKELLARIELQKENLIKIYGAEYFVKAHETYSKSYQTLADKKTGGIIVYAKKA
jgi:SAM-dependent methyltransferase